MVNIKRIGSGILGAGAVLFVAAGAEAGLPTFDAANIAGTMSIVKNGSQNLKGIGDITNKVGELNTIVGDAAASVSKFQEQYGDEINKGMEMAQKMPCTRRLSSANTRFISSVCSGRKPKRPKPLMTPKCRRRKTPIRRPWTA